MIRSSFLALIPLGVVACGGAETASTPAAPPAQIASETLGGDWRVDAAGSRVSFVSVKASEIAEAHHFSDLSGEVSEDGAARIVIGLDSVETAIDIRNERMRQVFFDTATYPEAVVTAQLDLDSFDALEIGARTRSALEANLSLHGADAAITPEVFVTRAAPNRVVVETVDPIIVNAADFNLGDGLAELQSLAGLPSITPDVPVTFSVAFER